VINNVLEILITNIRYYWIVLWELYRVVVLYIDVLSENASPTPTKFWDSKKLLN